MRRQRSPGLLALALVPILGVACSGGDDQQAEKPTPSSTSSTQSSLQAPVAAEDCDLATVPAGGEITFVDAGRLYGVGAMGGERRCLAPEAIGSPQWNGTGTTVIFDAGVVLSRPEGKSLLRIDDTGRLFKRPMGGGDEQDISFGRHEEVLYHPGGRHIASVGRDADDVYGIYVATNLGTDSRLVTRGEGASEISHLEWTESGALAFSAVHDGTSHIHRLDLATLELSTVDEDADAVSDVAASRFEGAGLAWATSSGSECSLSVHRVGRPIQVPDSVRGTRPVGWLPGGRLVVTACGKGATNGVSSLDTTDPSLGVVEVAKQATAVAIRVSLPSGPPLQLADIESQAPA